MIFNRISPMLIMALSIVLIGIIYFYGSSATGTCISIGDCRACYKDVYVKVDPSLCGNISEGFVCVKDKAVEKRNAMVDVLQCACSKYPDKFQEEKKKLHSLLVYSKAGEDVVPCDFKQYPVVKWKENYIAIPESLLTGSNGNNPG